VAQLSASLYDDWRGALYVTCLVATFDLGRRTITATNAGHPAAIVKGRSGRTYLRRGGPPAGLLLETSFERESVQLHSGDVCLIVTDGVTEALDGDSLLEGTLERVPLLRRVGDAARLCACVRR